MASTTPLHLFPSPRNVQPRKPSLRKPTGEAQELQGLALHFSPRSPPKVQPAGEHIKHSLFCEPAPSKHEIPTQRLPRRQYARRSASRPESLVMKNSTPTSADKEDQLSPLPINTRFQGSPPQRHVSTLKRLTPPTIATGSPPEHPHDVQSETDRLSLLPSKTHFTPTSASSTEYPTFTSRNASTVSKPAIRMSEPSPPMRSIFPQYDPTRSLNAQSYYPTVESPAQGLPSEKISKSGSPIAESRVERFDSAVALVSGYEHIPAATDRDLLAVWHASTGERIKAARKVQLGLHQQSHFFAVGASSDRALFAMEKALPQAPSEGRSKSAQTLAIEKQSPSSDETVPVAQLVLSDCLKTETKNEKTVVPIFPHQAAIDSLQAIADSPAAAEIATFDPKARSPEAARLAQDAVTDAHKRHGCGLTRATRERDSLGAVTAAYTLDHPSLGRLSITVTKTIKQRQAKAKISLHHPSATPAAVAAETLVLASFDFANDACILDLPSLLALETSYIIDMAITALFAVAAIENDALLTEEVETITFAPPPTTPITADRGKKAVSRSNTEKRRFYKRSARVIDKAQKELVGDDGPPVQVVVGLLGLSLKTAVFVLEAGVKVTAKVLIGVGHLAASRK